MIDSDDRDKEKIQKQTLGDFEKQRLSHLGGGCTHILALT